MSGGFCVRQMLIWIEKDIWEVELIYCYHCSSRDKKSCFNKLGKTNARLSMITNLWNLEWSHQDSKCIYISHKRLSLKFTQCLHFSMDLWKSLDDYPWKTWITWNSPNCNHLHKRYANDRLHKRWQTTCIITEPNSILGILGNSRHSKYLFFQPKHKDWWDFP